MCLDPPGPAGEKGVDFWHTRHHVGWPVTPCLRPQTSYCASFEWTAVHTPSPLESFPKKPSKMTGLGISTRMLQ